MKEYAVSEFMLERYRLDELSLEDKKTVEQAILTNPDLRSRLECLEESDRELRQLYPNIPSRKGAERTQIRLRLRIALLAAAVLLCVLIPVFILINVLPARSEIGSGITVASALDSEVQADRAKGQVSAGVELLLFLKGNGETALPNQAVLHEGNTVQLAYTVPAGADYYGVIFSIDGRSVVTSHFPYRKSMSTALVCGKRTFLNEAYTLDDAPDFEIFVFVVSQQPLDMNVILGKAEIISEKTTLAEIEIESKTAFEDCEVQIVSVLKN